MGVIVEMIKKEKMEYEETELRLGLPGNNGSTGNEGEVAIRKRGFSLTQTETHETQGSTDQTETIAAVDLKLNLSSKEATLLDPIDKPARNLYKDNTLLVPDQAKPPAKAQVVGWPPVQSFRKNMAQVVGWPPIRKNMLAIQKNSIEESDKKINGNGGGAFVKVSMDGAPYLRKVDLNMYKSYQQLSDALSKMLSSFTIGTCGSQGMKDYFTSESKLMDILNNSDYVPTYEDKDGDWMLVGDVPWEMFIDSCKRLCIMKGKEAIGLAPRAMEKRKNRS